MLIRFLARHAHPSPISMQQCCPRPAARDTTSTLFTQPLQLLTLLHVAMQQINEDEGIAAVHEAFRLGINFFDTSPFYGGTRSEQVSSSQGKAFMTSAFSFSIHWDGAVA